MSRPQVVAEVIRNEFVESRHHGSVIALRADSSVALAIGEVTAPMFPRSAMKPLQAAGMVGAGWQPADDEQIALACASHSGEDAHVAVVRRILARAGLDESALDNTTGMPLDGLARRAMIRAGLGPDKVHQNCSGKHAGMLATCVATGNPTTGYRDPSHPVQLALRATIEELCGETAAAVAVDGCGAPLFAVSLTALARGFARLAAHPVAAVMRAHPFLVGGTGRDNTAFMEAVPGLIAKDGAEGVYVAATSDGRAVAVKIEDGAARPRAGVLVAALAAVGVADPALDTIAATPVFGHGEPVGEVRIVLGL